MPEERGLYRDQKLEPTLHYLATLKGLSEKEASRRLEQWLKRLDLWDARNKKIQDLSRGMQQKAQLIATLVHEPDLIVVDEPFANLDPVNTRMAIDMLMEQAGKGKAIIMSTHLMYQVEAMCNRIVLIDRGRVGALRPGRPDQAGVLHQCGAGARQGQLRRRCPACARPGRRTTTGGCAWRPARPRKASSVRWRTRTARGSSASSWPSRRSTPSSSPSSRATRGRRTGTSAAAPVSGPAAPAREAANG